MPTPKSSLKSALLSEWLTRRVEFSIGGRAWPLVFTHRALFICEQTTGINMLTANMGNPSATLLRGLLFSALSVAGAGATTGDVGKRITSATLPHVRETVLAAWSAAMADPEPAKRGEEESGRVPTWLEAWAIARHDLRLSDEEWLDMTPRQCAAIQKLRLEQLQREELLIGILAATTENFSACHPDKPVSAETFMLHKFTKREPRPVTGEEIMAQMAKLKRVK